MTDHRLPDVALVILGHGSTLNRGSGEAVLQHAAELRRRGLFSQVREAFWKQEPQVAGVLAGLKARRIIIVPLFISAGYFSDDRIPNSLGFPHLSGGQLFRRLQRSEQVLCYARPVGTHEGMTEVLLGRAADIVRQHPFPRAPKPAETTLFIAGHGTEANANSRAAIEQHANRIRARALYAAVHPIFMEESPRIADCYRIAETKNLVVVPFFTSAGLHVQQDIPVLLGEPARIVNQRLEENKPTWRNPTERHEKRVWYTAAAGTDPRVADVILARALETAERTPEPAETSTDNLEPRS